ncbi:UDP-glucuronosyltransferase 2C1-like isoform X1 [Lytechinus variegatus]|uniref:UDP-glucuronosyltransferase 2C1-like isoform X1 n=1 Tax=Lytechinus variegatus TaxID=7654 RepID=UPI001BB1A69D|nr:UDP-glucuronosyltransferase 2C1-like isoform X1 [Lytechinus variegatus]
MMTEYFSLYQKRIWIIMVICLNLEFVHSLPYVEEQNSKPYKILVSMTDPTSMHSRTSQMAVVSKALLERGHSVTLLVPSNKGMKGFEEAFNHAIVYDVAFKQPEVDELKEKMMRTALGIPDDEPGWNLLRPLAIVDRYLAFFMKSCYGVFENETIQERLEKDGFDLMIQNAINPCDVLLAESLNIPYVTMTSSIRQTFFDEVTVSIPTPSSYVPFSLSKSFTDDMPFLQRTSNFIFRHAIGSCIKWYAHSLFSEIQREHNVSVHKTFGELVGRSQLWLAHTDFSLDFPRPIGPAWIPVGGLLHSETKPIPKDLENFVQGAGKHGVIIFSLGSMVTSLMDGELDELFAKVFSELPQRVLWRYVGPKPRGLGKNTRVMKWLPQNDLLGHPQTRLLIYHGGINGVYEAIYHQVPMVLLPIFADQPAMGARVSKKGMGVVLERAKLSHDTIKAAIEEVINNPKYKANIEHYGSIHRDTITSPLETAVFWIEHVLKFGGDHLRLRGRDLNFFVLNSFDVLTFFIVISLVILYTNYLVLRTCYRCCCRKNTRKQKSD